MSTHTTSTSSVAPGGAATPARPVSPARSPRGWAWFGVLAGAAGIASMQLSSAVGPVYNEAAPPTPESILAHLGQQIPQLLAWHVLTVATALLLLVFTAGLRRRLDGQAPAGSILPGIVSSGLVVVATVLVLGSGLNTQFIFGLSQPELMIASDVSFYSQWVATISWLWVTAGLSAMALGIAAMRGAAPRWLGIVSLVLGALTMLVGLSPLQYLAGFVGPVWLVVAGLGFAFGDRVRR